MKYVVMSLVEASAVREHRAAGPAICNDRLFWLLAVTLIARESGRLEHICMARCTNAVTFQTKDLLTYEF